MDTAAQSAVKEDPGSRSVARVYAIALLNAAGGDAASVVEELGSFIDVLRDQPQYDRLLRGGALKAEAKLALLDRTVAGRGSATFVNFLKVLAKRGRLELLPTVYRVAVSELERRAGQRRVKVVSAAPLAANVAQSIESQLSSSLGGPVILEQQVDPTVLGGLVIRVGDTVHDASLRTQIQQLRAKLRERCLNEIQRGRDRFCNSEGNR